VQGQASIHLPFKFYPFAETTICTLSFQGIIIVFSLGHKWKLFYFDVFILFGYISEIPAFLSILIVIITKSGVLKL